MIDIKELRIGNWVKRDSQPDGFQIDKYSFALFHNHQYDPIPLTEKRLVKFGFEKFIKKDSTIIDYIIFMEDYDFTVFCIDLKKGVSYPGIRYKVKYVHQLQNLCFALTQNELI